MIKNLFLRRIFTIYSIAANENTLCVIANIPLAKKSQCSFQSVTVPDSINSDGCIPSAERDQNMIYCYCSYSS